MNQKVTYFLLPCFFLLFAAIFIATEVDAVVIKKESASTHNNGSSRDHDDDRHVKLFVFGDSYADTGNSRKETSAAWKPPYGITFPGKPTGRFSDGRVLTDYIASFLGGESPVPYNLRNNVEKRIVEKGMNFAHGGTGVFNTMVNDPNMTTQIDYFEQLLQQHVYTKPDLDNSIAFVSVAGNDYAAFLLRNGKMQEIRGYTESIIKQLAINLRRIQKLGVGKIAVTAMEPMGCLPQVSDKSSYQNCSEVLNQVSLFHNLVLQQTVQDLNKETTNRSLIVILDLYHAFMSAFQKQMIISLPDNLRRNNVLKPCCMGVSNGFCGSVGENGGKKYMVCPNPLQSLYWDTIHPTQNAWHHVSSILQPSLQRLL